MDDGQTAGEIGLREVAEVFAHLHRRQHAFIDDGLARKRDDIKILVRNPTLYLFTNEVELALQVVGLAGDKNLLDVGLGLGGTLSQNRRIDRHRTHVHERELLALDLLGHDVEYLGLLLQALGQKHQPRAIFALFGDRDTLQQNELVRNLQQDTGTVAGLVVGPLGSPVLHVLEHLQGRIDQLVRLVAVDIDNHTYSARIVFVSRVVQTGQSPLCCFFLYLFTFDKCSTLHRFTVSFYFVFQNKHFNLLAKINNYFQKYKQFDNLFANYLILHKTTFFLPYYITTRVSAS